MEQRVWLLGPTSETQRWTPLAQLLADAGLTVGHATASPAGLDAVVLLETAQDADHAALDECRRVAVAGPPRPTVVLTEKTDALHIKALRAAGATDVIPRAWAASLLPDVVKRASARELTAQVMEDALQATGAAVWTGTVLLDADGQPQQITVFYSPRFRALLGFAAEEFPDALESWLERLHPMDEAPTLTALDAHLRLGQPYDVEFRLRRKDDSYGWFHARGQARRQGALMRMAGTLSDVSARRALTAEALAREQRLRDLMEQLPVGVVRVDGERIEVNAAVVRISGYPREELTTLGAWFDLLYRERAQASRALYLQESSAGFRKPRLATLTRRDGQQRLVEFQAAGDSQEAFWLIRDLTEGEREAELYRTLCASIPNAAVALFDHQQRLLLVEGPELLPLGLDRSAVVGRRAADVLTPALAAVLGPGVTASLAGQTSAAQVAHQGSSYEVTTVPVRNSRGDVMGGILLALNVTVRTHAVENVALSHERYRALLEGIPDVMLRVDADSTLLDMHVPAGTASPLVPADAVRKRLEDVLPAPAKAPLLRVVEEALRLGTGQPVEITLTQPGPLRTVEVRGVRSGAREVTVMCRDVTELHQMQQRLMISERMATVGTLAAGVTHEINNPLAYVTGNLQFLEDDLQAVMARPPNAMTPQALQGMLADMLASVKDALHGTARVSSIVQDLRLFSRVESQAQGAVALGPLLQTCLKMVGNQIRERAELVMELGAAASVKGNEGKLSQVFLNLLMNAVHAIPEGNPLGNRITVRSRIHAPGQVVVQIEDTGRGMTADVMGRVFEPFFTTKAVGEGTGLGLAICHGIVKSLGGFLEVESRPGQGSVFSVVLPQVPAAAPERTPDAQPHLPAAKGHHRVLVIDDDPRVGLALQRMLGTDCQVEIQLGAQGALARLRDGHRYDLVLCDLIMPQLTGMDFHQEVLARFPELDARLVFMTGGAFTQRAREFLLGVPNARLEKPFGREAFHALLASVLERAGPSTGAAVPKLAH